MARIVRENACLVTVVYNNAQFKQMSWTSKISDLHFKANKGGSSSWIRMYMSVGKHYYPAQFVAADDKSSVVILRV